MSTLAWIGLVGVILLAAFAIVVLNLHRWVNRTLSDKPRDHPIERDGD